MKKTNLDEMQEQDLLKIEHNGCWLAFFCLCAAIFLQAALGRDAASYAGEVAVLMILCLYMALDCLRRGIWCRRLLPSGKTNLLFSLLGAAVGGFFTATGNPYIRSFADFLLVFLISALFTFVLCFAALSLCSWLYKKRRAKLDQE